MLSVRSARLLPILTSAEILSSTKRQQEKKVNGHAATVRHLSINLSLRDAW
jgi:hypothetical protein